MSPENESWRAECIFREQRGLIDFFFERFDASQADEFVNEIVAYGYCFLFGGG